MTSIGHSAFNLEIAQRENLSAICGFFALIYLIVFATNAAGPNDVRALLVTNGGSCLVILTSLFIFRQWVPPLGQIPLIMAALQSTILVNVAVRFATTLDPGVGLQFYLFISALMHARLTYFIAMIALGGASALTIWHLDPTQGSEFLGTCLMATVAAIIGYTGLRSRLNDDRADSTEDLQRKLKNANQQRDQALARLNKVPEWIAAYVRSSPSPIAARLRDRIFAASPSFLRLVDLDQSDIRLKRMGDILDIAGANASDASIVATHIRTVSPPVACKVVVMPVTFTGDDMSLIALQADADDINQSSNESKNTEAAGGRDTLRIMIVEDNLVNLEILRSMVSIAGHEVVAIAENGEQAIGEYQQAAPDVILLDLSIPGQDGFDVCRALREQGSNTIIIAVSAHADETTINRALSSGMDDYITKPINLDELTAKLDKVAREISG